MNIDARSAGPLYNYASHYPFSRSKARSQQQAQNHTKKIITASAALLHEGLCSLGTILLGNRVFMGRSAGLFLWNALLRCTGRLFPQGACSNASWQKYLISESSGLVQADLTDDRVIVVLCSTVEAGALSQYFLSCVPSRMFPQEARTPPLHSRQQPRSKGPCPFGLCQG